MRPVPRRFARAASAGFIVAALVTALLPALPALAKGPIKVTGHRIETSVEHRRVLRLPDGASHVAIRWSGTGRADGGANGGSGAGATATAEPRITIAFGSSPNSLGEEVEVEAMDSDERPDDVDLTARARGRLGTTTSGVLWTGGAKFARITTDRPLGHVTVTAIDARADLGFVDTDIHIARGAMKEPSIYTRKQWGADEDLRFDKGNHEVWPPEFSPMQKAIVHHTAGRNHDPNPAATVRAIYYLKAVGSDFGDIGYNFLIDESGRIYEGRFSRDYGPGENHNGEDLAGNIVRGGHAKDFNDGTVGIALLGNFQHRQPTKAARNALERLLAWKLERHGLDPNAASTYTNPILGTSKFLENISGHRNVNPTACPGNEFYPKFPGLRRDVADRIAASSGSDDDTAPSVVSFTALVPAPTGATTIPFGLVFKEPVEGLEADDFEVDGSSAGWSVTDVSGGPSGYTIEVSADHQNPGDGSVELSLLADSIADLADHTGPPDSEVATAEYGEDHESPTVLLYQTPHKTTITNGKLDYIDVTATFSEPVVGFEPSDIAIGGTSHEADPWEIEIIFGVGAHYGFSLLNDDWRSGTLTFQLEAGSVTDLAGNPVEASNVVSMVFDR